MAGAPLVKTRWPGIYRRGEKYVYEWTDAHGQRRRGTAGTREEASRLKADREAEAAHGELGEAGARGRVTLAAYALEMYGADLSREPGAVPARGRYAGRRGAIRDSTRDDYRRQIERYWLPTLGKTRLGKIAAPDMSRVLAKLAARGGHDLRAARGERSLAEQAKTIDVPLVALERAERAGQVAPAHAKKIAEHYGIAAGEITYLADSSLQRIFAPMAALLATAAEEGLIPFNPSPSVRVPTGRDELRKFEEVDEDDDDPAPGKARALTREQLDGFLLVVDQRWRLFFRLLASTGLRVSEAFALRWKDLQLNGSRPVVRVRRAYVRGVYGPPKSRHGRRDVPIGHELVLALRDRRAGSEWPEPGDLVFPTTNGAAMDDGNLRKRTLKPAAEEAGAAWAGFHSFRHSCASMLIAEGRNIVQVSRWLGHHSASFTLDVYAHLMDDGVGDALSLGGDTQGVIRWCARTT